MDAGSDLWSLAVMLYEMATGMQPYQADSTERLERMIRSRIPPPPAPDPCPEAVRRILMKALASTPEARYQTAHEFEEDLQAFREGRPVKAVDEDLDATRRTFRGDRDETRRTVEVADDDAPTRKSAPVAATAAVATATAATPKPAPAERGELFYWGMRAVAALVLVAGVGAAWEAVSDYRLYQRGKEFEHDVAAEQITDPNQIWDRWAELSQDHPASLFLKGPRHVVEQKFVAAADHVIDTYRNNEAQTVYEADWQRARTMLLHALSADPDDRMAHGKLRLAEGHLARINGTSHKSAAELNDAVEKFTEAQQFMPQSPDPALGLARVYVYGLKDIDRASQAFDQAAKSWVQAGESREVATGRWIPGARRPAVVGFTQRARAAAGERPDPAGRGRLQTGPGFVPAKRALRKRQRAHGAGAKQSGERQLPAGGDRSGSAGECGAGAWAGSGSHRWADRCAARQSGRAEGHRRKVH